MNEKKQSMFGIVDEFEVINQLMEEAAESRDEAIKREAEEQLDEFRKDLMGDFGGKCDGYARVIQASDNRAAAIKEEKKRLDGLLKAEARKAERLRSVLFYAMETLDVKKYETDLHTFTIAKAGGAQAVEVNVNADDLADDYRTLVPESYTVDKVAIREALVAGEEIEGCKLLERKRSLRIR
jgi:hypothetical protein